MLSQDPLVTVSVWPCWAMPVIFGSGSVLDGGSGVTVAVGPTVSGVLPPALTAVTVTSIVLPTSSPVSV